MKSQALITSVFLIVFPFSSWAETLEISISKEVAVPAVNADVVITKGEVKSSNCDLLTEANQEGLVYKLEQNGLHFLCVPTPATQQVKRFVSVEIGGKVTLAEVVNVMAKMGKDYEIEQGQQNGFFSQVTTTAPSCRIGQNGQVDLQTCVCESELQIFDRVSKTCLADPRIVSFYANNCSDRFFNTRRVLEIFGAGVFPKDSVSFGMCGVELNHYWTIPHNLISKLLFFAYSSDGLKKIANATDDETIKLIVSQKEIEDLLRFVNEWVTSDEAQKYPDEIHRKVKGLKFSLEYGGLENLIEVIQE